MLGQALGDLGIAVLALPSLQNSLNPKVITSVRAMLAHMRVLQPDVIHATAPWTAIDLKGWCRLCTPNKTAPESLPGPFLL